ncbi:PIN domain-containing protein [Natronolimnobius baerhuensis]|uniref:Ribonuclease VapC n=1 Tax=Natronolimnobius baerhuensis TaxID=253108 RepID=A0A202E3E3_9EURY|nr:PIN domain-containing protein [Natronolimnobius baerhuensis]OVE82815.1 VapC toxin family PIN domain ribonuclease [Natronolimnobius baerhuensis]
MKVLDANFLIDYLKGDEAVKEFYEANGDESEQWVVPVPAYAEVLVGEGNLPAGDVEGARADLAWTEKHAVDEHTAVLAGEIADEIGPEGPFLDGVDAIVAAVGRELDAPVVSTDGDLTHDETKKVVDTEDYRN